MRPLAQPLLAALISLLISLSLMLPLQVVMADPAKARFPSTLSHEPTPTLINDEIQVTRYVVNMAGQPLELDQMAAMAQRFYTHFDDEYDFLFFMPESAIDGEAYGRFHGVRNDVVGIGKPEYNNTADYGSAGQLKGVIFLNPYGENGPTFHEMMHAWGAPGEALETLGFSQCVDRSHWGVAGVGNGQLGGFDPATLVDHGDGTFTVDVFGTNANGGDSVPYVPLELYLAGYIGANEVPPIIIPRNVACDSITFDPNESKMQFRAEGIDSVTIEEIQALLGVRSPASDQSQKDFRAAIVVVSEQLLSTDELAFYEEWARVAMGEVDSYVLSFTEATGGRGNLNMVIDPPAGEPTPALKIEQTGTPGQAVAGTNISFSAVGGDNGMTYAWDFGDSSMATGEHVEHVYTTPGTYTVTLTATTDDDSITATLTVMITAPAGVGDHKLLLPALRR